MPIAVPGIRNLDNSHLYPYTLNTPEINEPVARSISQTSRVRFRYSTFTPTSVPKRRRKAVTRKTNRANKGKKKIRNEFRAKDSAR